MSWQVSAGANGEQHVLPIDDLRPHEIATSCWCRPFDDDGVTVHNSLDRRERSETRGREDA